MFFISVNANGTQNDNDIVFKFGVSSSAFKNISQNDISAALKAYAVAIKKEQNLNVELNISLLTGSTKEIGETFTQAWLDGVSVTVREYMEMGIKPEYVFVGDKGGTPYIYYVLIVRNDDNVSIETLDTRKIVTCETVGMGLSLDWLETLIVKSGLKQQTDQPVIVENSSKAILQVFFKQADTALVTREAFEVACELNPQLQKKLRVLSESPPFISAFFMFHSLTYQKKSWPIVEKAILNLHKTPGGRQLLTIIQSRKMIKWPSSILKSTIMFLEEHEKLVKKPLFRETRQ